MSRYLPHIAATLSLGLPLIGSHLARMAIGVGDTVMVGWYGVEALAGLVGDELSEDYIIPAAFDPRVGPAVAKAVAEAARKSGVARI